MEYFEDSLFLTTPHTSSYTLPLSTPSSLSLYWSAHILLDKMASSGKLELSQQALPRAVTTPGKVYYPFWFGGSASCFAAGVTHPLDLGKASFWLQLDCDRVGADF